MATAPSVRVVLLRGLGDEWDEFEVDVTSSSAALKREIFATLRIPERCQILFIGTEVLTGLIAPHLGPSDTELRISLMLTVEPLLEDLDDGDLQVRAAALLDLGRIAERADRSTSTVRTIAARLDDGSDVIRTAAVISLARSARGGNRHAIEQVRALTELRIRFDREAADVIALDDLAHGISGLSALSVLEICLDLGTARITSVDALARGISGLTALSSLTLNFGGCLLSSVYELGRAIAELAAGQRAAARMGDGLRVEVAADARDDREGPDSRSGTIVGWDRTWQVRADSGDLRSVERACLRPREGAALPPEPAALEELALDLSYTAVESVDELARGISGLWALTSLALSLRGTRVISVDALGRGISGLSALAALDLNLGGGFDDDGSPVLGCPIVSVAELATGISGLSALSTLALNFNRCYCLNDVAELGRGLAALAALTTLHLDLSGSYFRPMRLRNIDALGRGITGLSALYTLRLHFDWCYNLRSADAQGRASSGYVSVVNVDGLRRGLAGLPAFTRCKITTRFHYGDPFLDWNADDDDRELSYSRASSCHCSGQCQCRGSEGGELSSIMDAEQSDDAALD